MNKKFLFLMAVYAILLTSCGDSEMKPKSTKISGPLGEYFEVVDRSYKVNHSGQCNIEIKRIKEGFPAPWEEGMKVGHSKGEIEIGFSVEYMDDDQDVEVKDATDIVFEREALEAVAALGVGESTTIPFDAKIKKATQFKVGSTFEAHEPSMDGVYVMKGTVGNIPVVMQYEIRGSNVSGTYYYTKMGPDRVLFLEGVFDDGDITLEETDENGDNSANWEGRFEKDSYTGYFIRTKDGKELNFNLSKTDEKYKGRTTRRPKASSNISYGSSYQSESVSSGSEDWDSILDSYERFVDQYISYLKRASNGDATALAEYPSLMKRAEEYGNKLQNAQGDLSPSQLARWQRINSKYISAMQ